jgi:hypothetical protein
MQVLTYVGALAVVTGVAGCSAAMPSGAGPAEVRTAIIVQNESHFDVDVYMWDGSDRATRLGLVATGDTADFDVPATVMASAGPYSLEARPTVSGEYPTNSEQFALRPGYRITWAIPPADAVGAADKAPPDTALSEPRP